jgi:hypothetical protein
MKRESPKLDPVIESGQMSARGERTDSHNFNTI